MQTLARPVGLGRPVIASSRPFARDRAVRAVAAASPVCETESRRLAQCAKAACFLAAAVTATQALAPADALAAARSGGRVSSSGFGARRAAPAQRMG